MKGEFRMAPSMIRVMVAALFSIAVAPVSAEDTDRERAQMLQMQQQLRRVQSDFSALQQDCLLYTSPSPRD